MCFTSSMLFCLNIVHLSYAKVFTKLRLFICFSHCCWGVHTVRQVMKMRVLVCFVIAVFTQSVTDLANAWNEYFWPNSL